MKAAILAYVVAAFCVTMSLQDTPFMPCNEGPEPKALRVKGCDSAPCKIHKGTDMTAQWEFVAIADAEKLKPSVRVTIMGATVNFPYPEKDACKSVTNGKCPLKKGDEVTYNVRMPISKSYPSLTIQIQFALLDENNKMHVCFKIDGKLISNKVLSSIEEIPFISDI